MNNIFISFLDLKFKICFALMLFSFSLSFAQDFAALQKSTFKDSRDGKVYKTFSLEGAGEWMAENLNHSVAPGKQSWCGGGKKQKQGNCSVYGRLYDWRAAKTACPAGWYLPSAEEYQKLAELFGGFQIAGKVLKSRQGWNGRGNGLDVIGFAALPAGGRSSGSKTFDFAGDVAYFWTSSEIDDGMALGMVLDSENDFLAPNPVSENLGYSVRCKRNVRTLEKYK